MHFIFDQISRDFFWGGRQGRTWAGRWQYVASTMFARDSNRWVLAENSSYFILHVLQGWAHWIYRQPHLSATPFVFVFLFVTACTIPTQVEWHQRKLPNLLPLHRTCCAANGIMVLGWGSQATYSQGFLFLFYDIPQSEAKPLGWRRGISC